MLSFMLIDFYSTTIVFVTIKNKFVKPKGVIILIRIKGKAG
ncbi:hypothetical protein [Clostridium beijerinckii]|nr:hypothetical protein [Clostridium beijerinckii]MBA2908538.1 hypothetical protein [Clostridium beijerinckii]